MQQLNLHLARELPHALLYFAGLWLPLLTACWCLWTQRAHLKTRLGVAGLLATTGTAYMVWGTAVVNQLVINGKPVPFSIGVNAHFPVIVAVLLAITVLAATGKRIDRRALFAGAFLSVLVVDAIGAHLVLKDGLAALGGGGVFDALVLAPVFAVSLSNLTEALFAWCIKRVSR